jgi:hypothetical protein
MDKSVQAIDNHKNIIQSTSSTIASKGSTAWQHTNGLWIYIMDAKGRLVHGARFSAEKIRADLPAESAAHQV